MSRPDRDDQREAGFTLVEVLVSMFIFSLITIGALIALTTTLDARDRAETRLTEVERLAAARRLMADDFAMMIRRNNRDGLGGFVDPSVQTVQPDQFDLVRRGRPNPDGLFARGDLLRVQWRVENGQLIRAYLPHENPAYVEAPIDRVVLDGVESMRLRVILPESVNRQALQIENQIIARDSSATAVNTRFDFGALVPRYGLEVRLTHTGGTTTRHIFEIARA